MSEPYGVMSSYTEPVTARLHSLDMLLTCPRNAALLLRTHTSMLRYRWDLPGGGEPSFPARTHFRYLLNQSFLW